MAKPTRSQLIGHLVTQAVLDTRMKWGEYAAGVVAHYHATVDVTERVVSFHVVTSPDNHDELTRLNTQTVKRVLIGEIRMPADLEESLLAPFPLAVADRIDAALLARRGLLLARAPVNIGAAGAVRASCELLRKTAGAVERIAPMLENHQIGPEDAAHFADADAALDGVMGCVLSVKAQIRAAADPDAKAVH
ncbi:MAG: hypothetical protein ACREPV_01280 [Lysobacter sp.]